MSKPISLGIVWPVAFVCLLAGLATGVPTFRHVYRAGARLEGQNRLMVRLQAKRASIEPLRRARQSLESLPERQPVPFGALADRSAPPGATVRVADPAPVPESSWTVHRAEIEWTGQADIGSVLRWASEIEMLGRNESDGTPRQPAWRLAQLVVRSAPARPGSGEILLQFEAVGKANL